MTATKTKPKIKTQPMNFKQLLGRVKKHEAAASLLKTATQTGWLTDETFLTKMTPNEMDEVKSVYDESPDAKRAKVADVEKAIPTTVGPMADEPKSTGNRIRVTAGTRTVEVDGRLFRTMLKRHPKAMIYLPPVGDEAVVFSEKSTVAVLPAIKD